MPGMLFLAPLNGFSQIKSRNFVLYFKFNVVINTWCFSWQYYLKTGTCKFGASCKFHHPKNGGGYLSQAPLNVYGYPLRPV